MSDQLLNGAPDSPRGRRMLLGSGTCQQARAMVLAALVASVLPAAACGGRATSPAHHPPLRGILLISLDTLRADRLGSDGYERPTTPALDRLAASGARFADALTPATTTRLAHGAILRGTLASGLTDSPPPALAEVLAEAGYRTAAFVDGGFMRARFGHAAGFELYVDDLARPAPAGARPVADRKGGGLAAILPRARTWLQEQRDGDRPWLLFLHTYDVHCPYDPPAEDLALFTGGRAAPLDASGLCGRSDLRDMALSAEQLAYIGDLYDAGVRHVDRMLGDFLEGARTDGLLEGVLISVFSDHGESLGEEGWFGHGRLAPEQVRVPWILAGAGVPPRTVVTGPGHLLDMMPTLLDYAAVPPPPGLVGTSLRSVLEGSAVLPQDRLRVVESKEARGLVLGPWMVVQALRDGRVAAVRSRLGRTPARSWPEAPVGTEQAILEAWTSLSADLHLATGELEETGVPEEGPVKQELRTLGYVD